MRVRWSFIYETRDFRFGRVHTYDGTILPEHRSAFGLDAGCDSFTLKVVPDAKSKFPHAEQTGQLHVELRGRPEETREFAIWIIVHATDRITFSNGKLTVHSGLLRAERLPETPEEVD